MRQGINVNRFEFTLTLEKCKFMCYVNTEPLTKIQPPFLDPSPNQRPTRHKHLNI